MTKMPTQKLRNVWSFSLAWLLASLIGLLLSGFIFGIILYPLVFFEHIETNMVVRPMLSYVGSTWGEVSKNAVLHIYRTLSNLRLLIVGLMIDGALLGQAQWLILKRYGIYVKGWTLAVMCGWTLGFVISQEASWFTASIFIDELGPHWEQYIMLGYTLFGLFFGTLMGISQGVVLHKNFHQRIVSWALLNMAAWTFAYFFSEIVLDKIFWSIVGYPNASHDSRFGLHNTVMQFSELVIAGTFISILLFRKFSTPAYAAEG